MTRQREKRRWYALLYRCENPRSPAYRDYGGRGINVCEAWHDFETYYADIMRLLGPCPEGMSIDRINNDGDYEPGNVQWASVWQQALNSRHYGRSNPKPAARTYIAPVATHPYVQIADHLRAAINSGELAGRLSFTEIRDAAGASMGTVNRAVQILKDEGLVYGVPGRGTFVRKEAPGG